MLAEDRAALGEIVRHAQSSRRLRLDIEALRFNDSLAGKIEQFVREKPGVEEVRANPLSGRVLIRYARGAPVLDELERLACTTPVRRARGAPATRPAREGAMRWHAHAIEEVARELATDLHAGLEAGDAARRLARYGDNLMGEDVVRSKWEVLAAQVANLPTGLLIGSAVLSLLLGDYFDAAAIATAVGINAAIGYRIERKNEELLASWRRLEAGTSEVLRGGAVRRIAAADLDGDPR